MLVVADPLGQVKVIGADATAPRGRTNKGSIGSLDEQMLSIDFCKGENGAHKTAFSETTPELALVLAASEDSVSLEDGVTRIEEPKITFRALG